MLNHRWRIRWLLAWGLLLPTGLAGALAAQPGGAGPDTAKIRGWVQDLANDSYRRRESATDQLCTAGRAAVDPLVESLQQGDLEVIVRGVKILRVLAMSEDQPTATAARQALENLGSPAVSTLADHVRTALSELAEVDQTRAYEKFQQLGGRFGSGSAMEGPITTSHAILGKGWEGGAADVKLLQHMLSLDRLSIFGPRITDQAIPHLLQLTQLKRLELYGTRLSAEGLRKIRNALRATDIEERRGGLLGVSGNLNSVDCLVTSVRDGSAAQAAGIQAGDVVLGCQGKPVQGFQSLTGIIAAQDGGDTIELSILRGGVRLTLQATLGEWE